MSLTCLSNTADPFVLRCAVVIFREDGLALEGGCVFCPRGHKDDAFNLPQTGDISHLKGYWISF